MDIAAELSQKSVLNIVMGATPPTSEPHPKKIVERVEVLKIHNILKQKNVTSTTRGVPKRSPI